MIGNKFDKVIKDLTADESVDEEKEDTGVSGEDLLAEQKRQEAMEKERKARQAKTEQDREEARQKIRDKYNIKKKDELSTLAHGKTTTTTTTTLNENQTREVHQASNIENQDLTADESVDEEKEDTGISGEDLLAEQKRQEAMEKERKARQAKTEQDREEARQKIRDKYNIKKKDELSTLAHGKTTTTTTTTLNENQTREVHQASNIENQVKPNEIYLDNNHQSATHLQSLCALDEPVLSILYEIFGSKWLSESVQRTLQLKMALERQEIKLEENVQKQPSRQPSLSSNGTVESISSTMERDRVNNFGAYKSSDNGDIRRIIGTNRH
ncbi:unnamed protein product [Rotaria sp. Silwood1]|nr:unnamed protein product [Rotaria sp. Silwood1]